jgi:hypothetical protein
VSGKITRAEAVSEAEQQFLIQPTASAVEILRKQTASLAGDTIAELAIEAEQLAQEMRQALAEHREDEIYSLAGTLASTALAILGRNLVDSAVEALEKALGGFAAERRECAEPRES